MVLNKIKNTETNVLIFSSKQHYNFIVFLLEAHKIVFVCCVCFIFAIL